MLATPPKPVHARNSVYFLEESIALKRESLSSPVLQTLLNLMEFSSVSISYGNLLLLPAPTLDPMSWIPYPAPMVVCQAQLVKGQSRTAIILLRYLQFCSFRWKDTSLRVNLHKTQPSLHEVFKQKLFFFFCRNKYVKFTFKVTRFSVILFAIYLPFYQESLTVISK